MGFLDMFKKKTKKPGQTYVYPSGSYTIQPPGPYPPTQQQQQQQQQQQRFQPQQLGPHSYGMQPDNNFGQRMAAEPSFHGSGYRQRRDSNSSIHSVQSFHSQGHNRYQYGQPHNTNIPNFTSQRSYGSAHSLVYPTAPPAEPYQILVQNTNDFLKSHAAVTDSTGSLHNPQDYNDHQQKMHHRQQQMQQTTQSYRGDMMMPHDIGNRTTNSVSYRAAQTPDHMLRGPVIYDSGYVKN